MNPRSFPRANDASFAERVRVFALFAFAPMLPGYRGVRLPLWVLAVALFSGCAWNTPPATVHQPMTARPAPPPDRYAHPGAIYQPDTARLALFQDIRARWVGDTITIVLEEKTSASKKSSSAATRNGSTELSIPVWNELPGAIDGIGVEASSSTEFEGEGDAASNNAFTGRLAVTVIEVYENGNLLVSGEKQVTINRGTEYIRFSGVVNPSYIRPDNSVSSTRVADARLEYRGTGYIDEAQTMGWLSRLFLTVSPF
jgi:flagellar L-ring protein FlgH